MRANKQVSGNFEDAAIARTAAFAKVAVVAALFVGCSLIVSDLPGYAKDSKPAAKGAAGSPIKEAIDLFNKKSYGEALAKCDVVIKATPTDIPAHYYKALSLHYLNRLPEAKVEYAWVSKTGVAPYAANATNALQVIANAAVFSSKLPRVLDFYTTWCVPCKQVEPMIKEVAESYKGKVDFVRVDAEDPSNKQIVDKYLPAAEYPTLVFVDKAGKSLEVVGRFNRDVIVSKISTLFNIK